MSRMYAWMVEAVALGWVFARELFEKQVVPAPGPGQDRYEDAEDTTLAAQECRAYENTGRAADRNMESEADAAKREKWGLLFIVLAFVIAIAAGFGFLFVYWSDGGTMLLGGMLALCLGGIGVALVLASHWLMQHKQATEPREIMPSSPRERAAASDAYGAGAQEVHRRGLLISMSAVAAGLLAAIVASLLRSLGTPPGAALFTTVWKPGQRLLTAEGRPVSIHSLQPGSSVTVFPEDGIGQEKTQTVLIRVQPQLLKLPEERANWAPMGYVAYSRVCTHAGCTVGLFEAKANLLLCPCHQSTFDVLRAGVPTGGPAARPLPQLPLYADGEGNLRAGGGFTAPPGPGFTGMPA